MFPVHPLAQKLLSDIDDGFAAETRGEPRAYIGASMAGTDCLAKMALSLRGYPDVEPEPQLKRIFHAGHRIEDWVVHDLKKRADLRVWEKDDITGRQHRAEWLNGHVVCHSDGLVDFEDGSGMAILEIKSMNLANFTKFRNDGVKSSHRHYYRQMVMMMAMFNIERSLFVSYNKNNSQYHAEIVPFDQDEWSLMYVRIQAVLDGQADRISTTAEDWRCKGCFKRDSCWSVPELTPDVRYCKHSYANKDGGWTCKHGCDGNVVCNHYEQFAPTPKV